MTADTYALQTGSTPLLVSLPHVGTQIPVELAPRFVERALAVEDTDWHLETVYDFARDLGAGLIVPRYSRYVIDLNRSPDDAPMYAGVNNTSLCPTQFFNGEPLYRAGAEPDASQIAARLTRYWHPYHDALAAELRRLKARHGYAMLWDGHSICSQLPWLFDGRLPELNLGTADGASCAPALRAALIGELGRQSRFSHVTDGRFKGGYITRRYGRPDRSVHAVQMEMCFSCYMDERPPWSLDAARVGQLRPVLRALLQAALAWKPDA